ncbi:hypothetical protein [Pseudoalteromonas sp. Of11M-6]|uniref:hypothetical protein n=1 Tax=Pseudoalteromonas sp. Of11M-6 TaxID=2917754 RepID=UPI001EF6B078|nr:hypothetical protein [Pseudoalteromonas sp. Of11M-6]MCG7556333.1 hypothetical protein [Pseudoalteromonas sp. Of11M-6]
MFKNIKYKLIALVFIFTFLWIWIWQLGYLAIPENVEASEFLRSWMNPGVMAFPTIISIFCFFAANYFLTKKNKQEQN